MQKINNIKVYNERMDMSLFDKLWFIDKVDADIFVDFGCANANMIKFLGKNFPEKTFIGYDISTEMVYLAMENTKHLKNIIIMDSLDAIKGYLKTYNGTKKTCLILSSVMHEIISYGTANSVNKFYCFANDSNFDYIAIRDMNFKFVRTINFKHIVNRIYENKKYSNQLKEFEAKWGKIDNSGKNMIHFLLKYRYTENWNRELKENYLSFKPSSIPIRLSNYKIDYSNEYLLHHLRKQVIKDFGVDIKNCGFISHCKILLIRK